MAITSEQASSNGRPTSLSPNYNEPLENFGHYAKLRRDGVITPINSKQILWRALSSIPPVIESSGFTGLPIFTERDDKHQVFGVAYTINEIAEVTKAAASNPYHDKAVVLWGPTGAGKSNFVDVIVKAVEKMAPTIPYLVGIEGCTTKEDPDHLLNLKAARQLVGSDTEPHGELCPDCQNKYENVDDLSGIRLVRRKFRSRTGDQIVRLQPSDTKFRSTPDGRNRLLKAIQGADGGLLIIDELGDHPVEFLHEIKDLIRDGEFRINGLGYPMDVVVIGHTTDKEWQALVNNPSHRPVVERIHSLAVPYNLDTNAEVKVYEKGLNTLEIKPHIAPDTLQTWAELAVSTRLTDSALLTAQYNDLKNERKALLGNLPPLGDDEAKRQIKTRLYKGEPVPGFRSSDVKKIQQEGVAKDEGMKGLSPVAARGLLIEMLTNNGECLNVMNLFLGVGQRLEQNTKLGYLEKSEWLKVMVLIRRRWEVDLAETVLSAFRDDMEAKNKVKTDNYINECDLLLNKSLPQRYSSNGDEEPVNMNIIKETEIFIFGKALTDDERMSILRGLPRPGSRSTEATAERLKFDEGVRKMVREEGSYKPEEVLAASPKSEKEIGYIEEAKSKLVAEKDFCQTCASESIEYVSQMIRKSTKK